MSSPISNSDSGSSGLEAFPTTLLIAVWCNDKPSVKAILEGVRSHVISERKNLNPSCDISEVNKIAADAVAEEVNRVGSNHENAFNLAIRLGHVDIAEYLLDNGANILSRPYEGWSPMYNILAYSGHPDFMLKLMDKFLKEKERSRDYESIKKAMESSPDFSLSLHFSLATWLPLISRFMPEDTFHFTKQGSCLRIDFALAGWNRPKMCWLYNDMGIYVLPQSKCSQIRSTEISRLVDSSLMQDPPALRTFIVNRTKRIWAEISIGPSIECRLLRMSHLGQITPHGELTQSAFSNPYKSILLSHSELMNNLDKTNLEQLAQKWDKEIDLQHLVLHTMSVGWPRLESFMADGVQAKLGEKGERMIGKVEVTQEFRAKGLMRRMMALGRSTYNAPPSPAVGAFIKANVRKGESSATGVASGQSSQDIVTNDSGTQSNHGVFTFSPRSTVGAEVGLGTASGASSESKERETEYSNPYFSPRNIHSPAAGSLEDQKQHMRAMEQGTPRSLTERTESSNSFSEQNLSTRAARNLRSKSVREPVTERVGEFVGTVYHMKNLRISVENLAPLLMATKGSESDVPQILASLHGIVPPPTEQGAAMQAYDDYITMLQKADANKSSYEALRNPGRSLIAAIGHWLQQGGAAGRSQLLALVQERGGSVGDWERFLAIRLLESIGIDREEAILLTRPDAEAAKVYRTREAMERMFTAENGNINESQLMNFMNELDEELDEEVKDIEETIESVSKSMIARAQQYQGHPTASNNQIAGAQPGIPGRNMSHIHLPLNAFSASAVKTNQAASKVSESGSIFSRIQARLGSTGLLSNMFKGQTSASQGVGEGVEMENLDRDVEAVASLPAEGEEAVARPNYQATNDDVRESTSLPQPQVMRTLDSTDSDSSQVAPIVRDTYKMPDSVLVSESACDTDIQTPEVSRNPTANVVNSNNNNNQQTMPTSSVSSERENTGNGENPVGEKLEGAPRQPTDIPSAVQYERAHLAAFFRASTFTQHQKKLSKHSTRAAVAPASAGSSNEYEESGEPPTATNSVDRPVDVENLVFPQCQLVDRTFEEYFGYEFAEVAEFLNVPERLVENHRVAKCICFPSMYTAKKDLSAKIIASHDCPVTFEDLAPIFGVLSESSKSVDQMRSFLCNVLPPQAGTPVSIELPLLPAIGFKAKAQIVSAHRLEGKNMDPEFFTVPVDQFQDKTVDFITGSFFG